MIGVVLWSNSEDRKAVFWCEDHGDLAFFDQCGPSPSDHRFFDPGDMVQFDVQIDRKLRKANNARLLEQRVCSDLPGRLRSTRANDAVSDTGRAANVIPFRAPRASGYSADLVKKA